MKDSQRIAGIGDWEYDFVDLRLLWSDEVYRILGLSKTGIPPNSEDFYRLVHPEDLAFVRQEKEAAAEGSRCLNFEHRIVRPDGAVRYIRQRAEITFDNSGRPIRESGTIQDVTENKLAEGALRQSEERFKFVSRAISDAVWDWDLVADTLWWNDGFLQTFGFGAGEIEPGLASRTGRIHPHDRQRVADSIAEAVAGGTNSWNAEYRIARKDATYAVVHDRGFILRDKNGKGVRMVGGMRDLTEQKKMEAQFLRAQRMESIGTLAGGIAHDLNNVLAPIMMSIELLKLDLAGDSKRTKLLETIYLSSRRGADLVRQILAFGRGIDGQQVAVRLGDLINELRGIASETFPRNIRIVADVPSGLWPVNGDPSQFHQVFLNLMVNARDAMPGGGTLTIAVRNTTLDAQFAGTSPDAKAGPYVRVQVTDTGVGIPPEVRDQIFEPFFTTKEPGKGTGLGLATVLSVVKAHGGFVSVVSSVGNGTTFEIHLPADPNLRAPPTVQPFQTELPHGRNELILVVDDELSICDITKQTLEAFGYRVITAHDGAEAVALYARRPEEVALVITDMMMPIMDGETTINVLTRINPSVRVIAASGLAVAVNVATAIRAGAPDFLAKPYSAQTLLKLVRQILDRPALASAGPVEKALKLLLPP